MRTKHLLLLFYAKPKPRALGWCFCHPIIPSPSLPIPSSSETRGSTTSAFLAVFKESHFAKIPISCTETPPSAQTRRELPKLAGCPLHKIAQGNVGMFSKNTRPKQMNFICAQELLLQCLSSLHLCQKFSPP